MIPPLRRKQRRTEEPLDRSERGEWKSWPKTQHSENKDHGIQSHHFSANRWGNNGNFWPGLSQNCPVVWSSSCPSPSLPWLLSWTPIGTLVCMLSSPLLLPLTFVLHGLFSRLLLFIHKLCPTLWLHGLQHTRLPCPSLSPGACSNSCPSRRWCHPTISFSVIPFFSCPQSFPASGSFPMSQLFLLQLTKVLEIQLLSVLPMNIQGWSPLGLIGLMSLQSKGLSKIFSNTTVQKHQLFSAQPSLWSNSQIPTWPLEKP